jgi:hypothetical protein
VPPVASRNSKIQVCTQVVSLDQLFVMEQPFVKHNYLLHVYETIMKLSMFIKQAIKPLMFNAVLRSNFDLCVLKKLWNHSCLMQCSVQTSIIRSYLYQSFTHKLLLFYVFFTNILFTSICHEFFCTDELRCFVSSITQIRIQFTITPIIGISAFLLIICQYQLVSDT